jgi:serine protease Do
LELASRLNSRKGVANVRVPHQVMLLSFVTLASVIAVSQLTNAPKPQVDPFRTSVAELRSTEGINGEEIIGSTEIRYGEADEFQLLVQEPSRRRAQRPQLTNPLRDMNQRSSIPMLRVFHEAIGDSWKSTVELVVDDERVAFGAVVDQDGWIISKDSQIPRSGKLVCRFADGTQSLAESVQHNTSLDLVLLRVPDRNLSKIEWAGGGLPQRGNWLATTDTHSTPVAVGVVSAGIMSVAAKQAVLGVVLDDAQGGALVREVRRGTGADLAGLRKGDKIRAINGQKLANKVAALQFLESCNPGQSIRLAFARGDDEMETQAQMMDLSHEMLDPTEMEVNGLISARSSGFNTVFLHDTVLTPTQCGGPLVDLNGHVVGINIARAGRVTSYALPTSTVRPEVERMLAEAKSSQVVPANANISIRAAEVR